MLGQKEALLSLCKQTLPTWVPGGSVPIDQLLTDDQRRNIAASITNDIVSKKISYSKANSNWHDIRRYVVGMMSNHFKKSREFNGGKSSKLILAGQTTPLGFDKTRFPESLQEALDTYFK